MAELRHEDIDAREPAEPAPRWNSRPVWIAVTALVVLVTLFYFGVSALGESAPGGCGGG